MIYVDKIDYDFVFTNEIFKPVNKVLPHRKMRLRNLFRVDPSIRDVKPPKQKLYEFYKADNVENLYVKIFLDYLLKNIEFTMSGKGAIYLHNRARNLKIHYTKSKLYKDQYNRGVRQGLNKWARYDNSYDVVKIRPNFKNKLIPSTFVKVSMSAKGEYIENHNSGKKLSNIPYKEDHILNEIKEKYKYINPDDIDKLIRRCCNILNLHLLNRLTLIFTFVDNIDNDRTVKIVFRRVVPCQRSHNSWSAKAKIAFERKTAYYQRKRKYRKIKNPLDYDHFKQSITCIKL